MSLLDRHRLDMSLTGCRITKKIAEDVDKVIRPEWVSKTDLVAVRHS